MGGWVFLLIIAAVVVRFAAKLLTQQTGPTRRGRLPAPPPPPPPAPPAQGRPAPPDPGNWVDPVTRFLTTDQTVGAIPAALELAEAVLEGGDADTAGTADSASMGSLPVPIDVPIDVAVETAAREFAIPGARGRGAAAIEVVRGRAALGGQSPTRDWVGSSAIDSTLDSAIPSSLDSTIESTLLPPH